MRPNREFALCAAVAWGLVFSIVLPVVVLVVPGVLGVFGIVPVLLSELRRSLAALPVKPLSWSAIFGT
jgi:hypothetical protein